MTTSKVFIPHEDLVWVTGEIVSALDSKGQQEVRIIDEDLANETKTRLISLTKYGIPSLPQQNTNIPAEGVDDMIKLSFLHEPAILHNLQRRFKSKIPYTYTGEVCVAVNPYQWLPIYTNELRETYSKSMRHELQPHVYSTSADAYRGLTIRTKNQSILVTGESGAGKTETVKILMEHLAFIAGKCDDRTINKLLRANPLLESFGNAKTARNDNSSRFGKFAQLEFDDYFVLVGSKCITYLLEKNRVITQTKLERNYHIMYQLLAAPDSVKSQLLLTGNTVAGFNYTSSGDTKTNMIEGMTDSDRYIQTVQGLELLGVGPKLRSLLEQAIAGILHMGQVNFHATKGSADASYIDLDESTKAACKMLGVIPNIFATSVVSRVIEVEGKKLDVPLSANQSASGRDALAKEIYSRIFNWLILVVNFNTSFSCNATDEVRAKKTAKNGGICSTISLLDIFGFECFAKNGFEQFCINYANEKLQQRFTQDVFMTVQREYQEEGLPWEIIKYKDNQDILDMIEGRLGIADLLNEECQIPKGTEAHFMDCLKANFSKHNAFSSESRFQENFTIRHCAGQVTYTVTGFMDANKDSVPNNLISLMSNSNNFLLKRLFSDTSFFGSQDETQSLLSEETSTIINFLLLNIDDGEYSAVPVSNNFSLDRKAAADNAFTKVTKKSGGFVVAMKILNKFKNQLSSLMETINSTDIQYVRTIKPNSNRSNTEYNRRMVVEQLRSAGMIEAVRISRAAYPNRLSYNDFLNRYRILKERKWHDSLNTRLADCTLPEREKKTTQALLHWLLPDNKKDTVDGTGVTEHYAFGNTKVYFTSFFLEALEDARNVGVTYDCTLIQKIIRGFLQRRKYLRLVATVRDESAEQERLRQELILSDPEAYRRAMNQSGEGEFIPSPRPPLPLSPTMSPNRSRASSPSKLDILKIASLSQLQHKSRSVDDDSSQDTSKMSSGMNLMSVGGDKLHPQVAFVRDSNNVKQYRNELGGSDFESPITVVVEQIEKKMRIKISTNYRRKPRVLSAQ